MVTRHFFKILTVFIIMIILGLAAIFASSYFGGGVQAPDQPQIAK